MKNNYPWNFIDSCIKLFLNKLYTPKVMVPNIPKSNVFVKWPLLGSASFQIRKKLQKLFCDKLTSCNLKIVFASPFRIKSFFTFKDKLLKMLLSGLVYKYKCGGCNATYYGKTKRHFRHVTSDWKKDKDGQQQANGDPRTLLMLQLLSVL